MRTAIRKSILIGSTIRTTITMGMDRITMRNR